MNFGAGGVKTVVIHRWCLRMRKVLEVSQEPQAEVANVQIAPLYSGLHYQYAWEFNYATLHLRSQIIGKLRLAHQPHGADC